jgi:DNA-binding NarL/FixJ family response regulator
MTTRHSSKAAQAVLERDRVTVAGAAGSCAEAIRRAEALRPDVVLIDIRLGQGYGPGSEDCREPLTLIANRRPR